MKTRRSLIASGTIVLFAPHHVTFCAGAVPKDVKEVPDDDKCGIYFAPSTIPGAGYGLFAAKPFKRKEYVTPGDLAVPIIELDWNNGQGKDYDNLWSDYHWSARTFPGMNREGEHVTGASFGIGAVPNCFHPLINLEVLTTKMDSGGGLHRSRDPGAGAFTPYHNRRSYAWRNIRAGMELFVDYGSKYFATRTRTYGIVPTEDDYDLGDDLLEKFVKVRDGSQQQLEQEQRKLLADDNACANESDNGDCKDTATAAVQETKPKNSSKKDIANHPPLATSVQSTLLSLLNSLSDLWKSRTLKTLPQNPQHIDYVKKYGTANLYYNRSIRSLSWLQENGLCMDHIRPGRSTIPQAGRGGFAARVIQEGDVVAGVPLVHLPDRDIYRMYESMPGILESDADLIRNVSAPVHWQLMLNYCFGHRHSSVLLCPYGILTSSINHAGHGDEANIKLRWSKKGSRHYEWLEQPVEEWATNSHSGLALEYVATREIDKNEEILLDYGDEWQAAWDAHVANWVPPPGSELYAAADELNRMVDLQVKTVEEGSYDPKQLHLYCRETYRLLAGLEPSEDNLNYHFCRVTNRYHTYINNDHGGGIRNETRYTAEVYTEAFDDEGEPVQILQEVLFDLPRDAFYFRDAYYSRDIHLRTAFRHDLRIPDEIMPKAWLNRLDGDDKGEEEEEETREE